MCTLHVAGGAYCGPMTDTGLEATATTVQQTAVFSMLPQRRGAQTDPLYFFSKIKDEHRLNVEDISPPAPVHRGPRQEFLD